MTNPINFHTASQISTPPPNFPLQFQAQISNWYNCSLPPWIPNMHFALPRG